MRWSALTGLAVSMAASFAAASSDVQDEVSPSGAAFIDNGVVYGVNDRAVFRHDLAAGAVRIQYFNGESVEREAPAETRSNVPAGYATGLMVLGRFGVKEDAQPGQTSGCVAKAGILVDAINAYVNACAGGGESSCTAAKDFYRAALPDFNTCMQQ